MRNVSTIRICLPILLAALASACSHDDENPNSFPPGALVRVEATGKVGVVLDEIPESQRLVAATVAFTQTPWLDRARAQLRLTTYRLVFRSLYYDEPKQQLPLPPEDLWTITFDGESQRETIDGHDVVTMVYHFSSTLLTDAESPGISEPALATIGGTWDEDFVLPVDPLFIFQRTRFACMDESEFPPHSVDSEETDTFYDDTCDVEDELTTSGCHQTELPEMSCVDAVADKIGRVEIALKYTRLPWDDALANSVRRGEITNKSGADLVPEEAEFREHRVTYRYIPPDDCTLEEQCVGAPGWRRLLQFSTADRNVGTKTLEIGAVDYFIDGQENALQTHHVFEYSACHNHYHFRHYGSFTFNGDDNVNAKRGFCLQSTNRFSNNEYSPLHNPYGDCGFQGIEVGWVDEYKAGIECQWVDVTDVDTKTAPVVGPLAFTSNPDGFLCEGTPILDAQGNFTFVPTDFLTEDGEPVDKPGCNYYGADASPPLWIANNSDSYDVTLPVRGNGYVTEDCKHGEIGPLRNCDFAQQGVKTTCAAGHPARLRCVVDPTSAPQVVRLCNFSEKLAAGLACTYQDSLANAIVTSSGADVSFTCPDAREDSDGEPGGSFSTYTAPVLPQDASAAVNCVALPP